MSGRSPGRRAAPQDISEPRRLAPRDSSEPPWLEIGLRAESRRWSAVLPLAQWRLLARRAVDAAIAVAPVRPMRRAGLDILLTDDRRIARLNRDWRGLDKPTNVLSFPAVPPERVASSPLLGDIVLAHETLVREAEGEDKALEDHFSHLVIHGLLHLLGEDHESEAEANRMEALEIAALSRLGIRDPYADSEPVPVPASSSARHSSSS